MSTQAEGMFPTPANSEQPRWHEHDPSSAPQVLVRMSDYAPQVALSKEGLIPVSSQPSIADKRPAITDYETGKFFDPSDEIVEEVKATSKPVSPHRKLIYICLGTLALLAIVAAVIGGVVGSRKANSKHVSGSITSSSTSAASAQPTGTGFQAPGSPASTTVNDAWAYNGTSLSALTFSTTSDTTGTNYLVFYQHSNGEIRQTVYNNSIWHNSELVTTDAHPGTPVSAYWKGDDFELSVFYFDKNEVLQELRGKHGSDVWLNGTLGTLSITSNNPSSLNVQYVGTCLGKETAWLVYHTGIGSKAQVVYWDGNADNWALHESFDDVRMGSGFAGHNDVGVWRFYYTSDETSQIKELVCPDCCGNSSSTGWKHGLNGPDVKNSTGGVAVANLGLPRLLYYPDSSGGGINELNNSLQYPNEVWMEDVSSSGIQGGGNKGSEADPTASVGPPGMNVATGIPNSQVAMAAGFRGTLQQIWLFYQLNETGVFVQTRDADAAGNWSSPVPIPVSR